MFEVFNTFNFQTESQALSAQIFTLDQVGFIQNTIIDVMQEKLKLAYDPGAPEAFKFQHEYLRGQLEAFNYLLDCHHSAINVKGEVL